jgi:hypothetical protein
MAMRLYWPKDEALINGQRHRCRGCNRDTALISTGLACLRRSGLYWEDASLSAGGGSAAGESSGDGVDGWPSGSWPWTWRGVVFVVAGQAAVRSEPGEGPFCGPSAWDDGETRWSAGLRTMCSVVARMELAREAPSSFTRRLPRRPVAGGAGARTWVPSEDAVLTRCG